MYTVPSFPLNRAWIRPDLADQYSAHLTEDSDESCEEHEGVLFHIEDDEHINVPTLVAHRFPHHMSLLHLALQRVLHGRTLENIIQLQELHRAHVRTQKERVRLEKSIRKLEEDLARVPRKQVDRKAALEHRIEEMKLSLSRDTLSRGVSVQIKCVREQELEMYLEARRQNEGAHTSYEIHLNLSHLLNLEQLPTDEALVPVAVRTRHGSISLVHTLHDLVGDLKELHSEQTLPGILQGLPMVYAGLFGLMVEHQREHGLEWGTCYYTRKHSDGQELAPKLLMQMLGYHEKSSSSARRLQLQVKLLQCTTISGTQGDTQLEKVPLLMTHEESITGAALPDGVRAGTWSMVSIPEKIKAMQKKLFTQVPKSLLLCHKPWIVNVGLHLKALDAMHHGQDDEGFSVQLGRLMQDTGLRQSFRKDSSRDRDILARALSELEELGLVSGLMTKALDLLESEEIPGQLPLPFDEDDVKDDMLTLQHPSRRPPPRRRHRQALTHHTIRVMLYTRRLYTPPEEALDASQKEDTRQEAQTPLPLVSG